MPHAATPGVFLIGGAPGAGKTTLGTALATRLGIRTLGLDDLVTAVQAVTTPDTHPGLHLMWKTSHLDYFTDTPPERLIQDARRQHEAAWPFIERVIRKHVARRSAIVMDGWYLWPSRVAQLPPESIWAGWIVATPSVLEERERKNVGWLQGSRDPRRMLDNFLSRSLWFNAFMEEQARQYPVNVLHQRGATTVERLCEMVLESLHT